ncbi:MAG: RnfABCDGE type electron transport complex subunit D [Spirochaetota bacterium]
MADPVLSRSNPPQYHDRASTARIMWTVTCALLPAAAWGVYVFGWDALVVLAASIVTAVAAEALAAAMAGRVTLRDGSAVLTGLLIGMGMPPAVPLFIPVVAAAFAMFVVKWSFGGLGTNWMNPALAARVFVFFSWTGHMTRWTLPRTLASAAGAVDGASAATPLGIVQEGAGASAQATGGPLALLRDAGYPVSALDVSVSEWLNAHVLGPLGINMPSGYVDPFVGNVSGSIGEVSALLLLLGTIVLFASRIITWEIPAAYFLSFAVFTRLFGGLVHGQGLFAGDVLFSVLTGGFVITAFYLATDTVTSPMTRGGMLIYGAGAGFLTFLLRTYGRFPEAAALAVILMNVLVPLIDRHTRTRRFGTRPRAGRRAARSAVSAAAGREGVSG